MLVQKEYYEIFIYNNEIAIVEKIDEDIYNYFKDTFDYVYHTKNGDTYQQYENFDAFIDMLITEDACIDVLIVAGEKHLYELLDDLREQGFCDSIEFKFIDDYFGGNYKQYIKAF